MSVDSQTGPDALVQAWRLFGSHAAVIAGSGTALLSLFNGAPVHAASIRGAIAYGVILSIASIGAFVARKTWRPAHEEEEPELSEERPQSAARPDGRERAA